VVASAGLRAVPWEVAVNADEVLALDNEEWLDLRCGEDAQPCEPMGWYVAGRTDQLDYDWS